MSRTIHFVSLGCPKNAVDTERMVGIAQDQGLTLTDDQSNAEIIVINTCGFIEAAKAESIETTLALADAKETGRCQTLIMAGCLSQRYTQALAPELPEVDHFLGTTDFGRLKTLLSLRPASSDAPAVNRIAVSPPEGLEEAAYRRALVGHRHSAYLKISEGCDRHCAFCSIPFIRGHQRSRTLDSLVAETDELARRGARELIVVAQDTTAYGSDLPPGKANLARLLRALDAIEGLRWIRVLYTYPSMIDAPLAETMASLSKVVPYIDIPLQHVDDAVLRRMRRGYTGQRARDALAALRAQIPGLWVRSTVLVGHPGETSESQQALLRFIEEEQIDHLGAFVFSPEEDTAAATQPDPVPQEVAETRRDEVLALQQRISRRRLEGLRGQVIDVMIDSVSDESEFLLAGRHAGQAPEVDGQVILADAEGQPGDIVRAEVSDSAEYDLVAHTLPKER